MKIAKILTLMVFGLFLASIVFAAEETPLTLKNVELNDVDLEEDVLNSLSLERGESLEIKTVISADSVDVDNVEVEVEIDGYDYDSISETSDVFDAVAGRTYVKTFSINLPTDMDSEDYQLKVRLTSRNTADKTYYFNIAVDKARKQLEIIDFSISPSREIEAGYNMIGRVRIENSGVKEQNDAKLTLTIPGLNLQDTQFLEELDSEDVDFFEDLQIFIPACTTPGTYNVIAELTYDKNTKVSTEQKQITVTEADLCRLSQDEEEDMTEITALGSQVVFRGESASYPLTLENKGSSAKTFTITLSGISSWGNAVIDPSNVVVVGADKTKTVFIRVTADEDANLGEAAFTATVFTDNGESTEVSMKADIAESEKNSTSVKKVLEYVLIVLVIVLILIGLVVGFRKKKSSEEDEEKTYY